VPAKQVAQGHLSKTWGVSQVRGQDGADHGAAVDGRVEPREERLHLGFLANKVPCYRQGMSKAYIWDSWQTRHLVIDKVCQKFTFGIPGKQGTLL
jgi:hypothetical protein